MRLAALFFRNRGGRSAAARWVLPLALLAGSGVAEAADPLVNTLNGLAGVRVSVESFTDAAKQAGFHQSFFRKDVELKLRMAGIKVLTDDEWEKTPGLPFLMVTINALHETRGEKSCYSAKLELMQAVLLERNEEMRSLAETWSHGFVAFGDLPHVRTSVKEQVDFFINAWLSVNPM